MAILVQQGKLGLGREEVGAESPLYVQVVSTPDNPVIPVVSRLYVTDSYLVPGIGTAAAYAAGDAFGTKFSFIVPDVGTITLIGFIDYDDEGSEKDFVLFRRDFTATADNSAFNVSDADMAFFVGAPPVNIFTNFGANQVGVAAPNLDYRTEDGHLYCQIVTQGIDNIAAGSIPQVFLVIERKS